MSDNGKKTLKEMAQEKTLEGCIVKLGELTRQDGIITEAVDKSMVRSLGVIQTLITAHDDDKDYRQILIQARWKNKEQRDKFVKAIAVCRITGAAKGLRTLLDMITADTAGDNGVLRQETVEGLTHTTLTTRGDIERKKKYDAGANRSSSPIA